MIRLSRWFSRRNSDSAGYPTVIRGIFCIWLTTSAAPAVDTASAAVPPAPASVDYRLELRLDPDNHRIEGVATLSFASPTVVTTLQLAPQAAVRSVHADGRAVAFAIQDGRLDLAGIKAAPVEQLRIDYGASFNDPLPGDTVGIEDPSYGVRASILTEGAFLAEGVRWFPQVTDTRGRHQLRITAPAGLVAVTAGRLVGCRTDKGETVTEWDNDFPLAGLALSAGHFLVSQENFGPIQLLTFLSAENAGLAPGYLSAMRRHLTFYRDLLGPYPFAKFAVVENFLPTGFGLPSWTLLGKSVVRLPFILDTSLPHEIVHSWWGNAIEVDYADGNWAEGLTTYLADYLLKEAGDPPEALAYRRKILRDYAALVTAQNDFPLREFTGRTARYQQAVGYGKGALFFHMLRRQVGDQAFWKALRQMASADVGRRLGWGDLEGVFAQAASQDLHWFFRQWLDQPGAPELSLAGVGLQRSDHGWTVSGSVRQKGPVYRLTIPLRLTTADGAMLEQNLAITSAEAPFSFVAASRPLRLDVDPANDVFRHLTTEELPPTVNDLINPHQPLVVMAEDWQVPFDALQTLLRSLGWQQAELAAEADYHPAVHGQRDLLLLGWPRRAELRPALPAQLDVSGTDQFGWRLAGEPSAGDVLFTVVARRQPRQGSRAIFLARTPAAARAVAAKISHYGRYSLLLFESGRNLIKLTWEAEHSPLSVSFP